MNSVMDTRVKPKSRNLSVNWFDMSIHERERQMVQFIGNSFISPKLIIRFQRDGGSNFTDRDEFYLERKQQNKISVLSEFLQYLRAIQGHTGGENDSTRDAVRKPHN